MSASTDGPFVLVYQDWELVKEATLAPKQTLRPIPQSNQQFSAIIQKERIKRRLTLESLADLLQISVNKLAFLEKGTELPSPELILKLEKEFDIKFG